MSYIPSIWIWLGIIACITLSALFAGLNLAIFSLSQLRLQIEADGGNEDAARVLDLRKNSNQVLATVIWGNVGTNVFLTLLSDSFSRTWCVLLLGGRDHVVRRDRPAGIFLAERFADDGAISALPDFLARRLVFPDQADGDTARLVARR